MKAGSWAISLMWVICYTSAALLFSVCRVLFNWYFWAPYKLKNTCLYLGRVRHTRFHEKRHHLNYPLFLSCIDLAEVEQLGWLLWPIFKVDGAAFCSLDNTHHLKGLNPGGTLYERAWAFITSKSSIATNGGNKSIKLLSHLTYFGYCFNPISIFYLLGAGGGIEAVIAEVSNTPWGEMHPYMLHESVEGVDVKRVGDKVDSKVDSRGRRVRVRVGDKVDSRGRSGSRSRSSGRGRNPNPNPNPNPNRSRSSGRGRSGSRGRNKSNSSSNSTSQSNEVGQGLMLGGGSPGPSSSCTFQASWQKAFHVSPFMDMDYDYSFAFSEPGATIAVHSQMHKRSTRQLAFTASFEMQRTDFTPLSLLYVLLFYPLHTRVLQLWIHIEALKLWWKGVTFFPHPLGHDVDLGFGITGERVAGLVGVPIVAAFVAWFAPTVPPPVPNPNPNRWFAPTVPPPVPGATAQQKQKSN